MTARTHKNRIGILTGGGDCSGLNAAIRAITITAENEGYEVIGVKHGWTGLMDAKAVHLHRTVVDEIIAIGGTILGTSRCNPNLIENGHEKIIAGIKKLGLHALIAIGGDGTLSTAEVLRKRKINVIGVPKTVDRDLSETDSTIGFDTAINIVTESIDRLKTTAESHNRVMVLEVMGRHSGWIAALGGMAGGADYIVIPEVKFDLGDMIEKLRQRKRRGMDFGVVVAAEGAAPKGHGSFEKIEKGMNLTEEHLGGIGDFIANYLRNNGFETRSSTLGHIQRGGTPSARDRVTATRLGIKAVEMVKAKQFGKIAARKGNAIVVASLAKAVKKKSCVDKQLIKQIHAFFG